MLQTFHDLELRSRLEQLEYANLIYAIATSHIAFFFSSIVQRRNDLLRELFVMVQTTRQDMESISLGCETNDSDLQKFLERFDLNKEFVE